MYRQSSSRNHRSKRIRVRHVLQMCLLFAVSLWLIYQVKHSHDQKKESEEIDSELDGESRGGFIRIGRKDIPKAIAKSKDLFESAEDEETSEEEEEGEEIKLEEEIQEDKKSEDDETDERKLEKLDAEVDREEEFLDDEKDVDEQVLGNEKREDNIDEADNDENIKNGEDPLNVTYVALSENSTTPQGLNGNLTTNSSLFLQNATGILSELDHSIRLEEANNSTVDVGNNLMHRSSIGHTDPSSGIEASMEDKILKSEKTKNPEQVMAESVVSTDSSNLGEEKMVHPNLDPVPEVQQTEGNSPKGVAAQ